MVRFDEMGEIKKGPWKVEEDEVLINHVKKYGPKDWSSIRSKGLLRRTGKSCRLRWVNKLRPALKTGVKFSAEEERTVIDLQAKIGNKWATIATYLPGRTDNDVKNFWSSRQKRLARILHTTTPSSTKPHKNTKQPHNLNSSKDNESLPKPQFCPDRNMVHPTSLALPLPPEKVRKMVHPTSHSLPLSPEKDRNMVHPTSLTLPLPPEKKPLPEQQLHFSFPQFPLLLPDIPPLIEGQDFITQLGDPCFLDEFEHSTGSVLGTAEIPILPSFLGRTKSCPRTAESHNTSLIGGFMDDFPPMEIFDQIEPLPSPSKWL